MNPARRGCQRFGRDYTVQYEKLRREEINSVKVRMKLNMRKNEREALRKMRDRYFQEGNNMRKLDRNSEKGNIKTWRKEEMEERR